MEVPKFLKGFKTRFLSMGTTLAVGTGISTYLTTQSATQNLEQWIGSFATTFLIATAPAYIQIITGVANEIFSGDIHDRLKEQTLCQTIPPEATLYHATFAAFQLVLNEEANKEKNEKYKKEIERFRDISFDAWKNLVSLKEQDDISSVAKEILAKFENTDLVESQFTKNGDLSKQSFLEREDWRILLIRLQHQERDFLEYDLCDKLIDSLHQNFPTTLRSVFVSHQNSFQEVLLQLQEIIIGKLDTMDRGIQTIINQNISSDEKLKLSLDILTNRMQDGPSPTPPDKKFYPENFPSVTRFFTGRENVLENLSKTLTEKGRASLHGTWGLGKTSVVLEYAERN